MSQPYPEHIQASDSNHIPDLSQNILMPSHNPSAYNSFYQADNMYREKHHFPLNPS